MLQIFFTLLFLGGLLVGGQWLMAHPGEVVITWFGYDITLHIAVVAALLLMLMLVVIMLSVGFWQMFTWGSRRRARKKYRTLESGLKQLTLGVTALAMGDESEAQAALKKASALLPADPLPQLLTAQLLQRQGKHEDAQVQFKQLMQHEVTAALATRKLIEQHVTSRSWGEATRLTEEARLEAPKDRWLVLTLIDLYAREGKCNDILKLTEGWGWQSPLTREERNRYAALAHYLASIKQPDARRKEQSLRHAVGYAPDFLPAIIDFADVLMADNATSRARKWLLTAWEKAPSELLIEPILATIADESPRAQQRLLKPFVKSGATVYHHLLAGEQAYDAGDLDRARTALEAALLLAENKHALSLMAEIEKKENGTDAASVWLKRAAIASAGEEWVCDNCGMVHPKWFAHCTSCQHFDSLRYTRPESRITSVELTAVN